MTSSNDSTDNLSQNNEAWQIYQKACDGFRDYMMASPYAKHPIVRAQADYLAQQMQGVAFMFYGSSHKGYPLIRGDSFFTPLMYTWGFPNPDVFYRYVFLDGARRYRIYGKLGSARIFNDIHLFTSFWGSETPSSATQHYSIFDYARPDGSFEILLGPDVKTEARPGGGIYLSPQDHSTYLAFREVVVNGGPDTGMDISIELLDDVRDPAVFDEAEMNTRLLESARLIDFKKNFLQFSWNVALSDGVWHKFKKVPHVAASSDEVGANPAARYYYLPYDFAEDEALVIDIVLPECTYWGVQMMDMWTQTLDFSFHSGSANKVQSMVDDDGVMRLVMSHKDPGVPNWVDTVAPAPGIMVYRTYYATTDMAVPEVKRVKLADVRKELPANTPVVTPEQRKADLKARAHASLKRYGYF